MSLLLLPFVADGHMGWQLKRLLDRTENRQEDGDKEDDGAEESAASGFFAEISINICLPHLRLVLHHPATNLPVPDSLNPLFFPFPGHTLMDIRD